MTIIHCLLVRGPRLTHCNKMNRLPLLGEYYWLTCTIDEGNYNMLVNGVQTKQYSDAKFRCDYISKNGGIKVKFDGTSESVHFNWRTTKENPSKNNSKTNPKGARVNQQPNPKGARVNQPQASASTTSKRKRGEGEDDEVQIISVSAGPNATNTPQLVKRLSDKKQVHSQQPRTKADRDQLKRDGKINGYWKLPKGRPPKPKMDRVPMLANN